MQMLAVLCASLVVATVAVSYDLVGGVAAAELTGEVTHAWPWIVMLCACLVCKK